MLDTLVSAGAHLNISAPSGNHMPSVAHYALWVKDFDLLHVYIQRGGDVNAHNGQYATPLHMACRDASVDIVELLLQAGALPNTASSAHGQGIISKSGLLQISLLLDLRNSTSAVVRLVNCPDADVGASLAYVSCIDSIKTTQ